MAETFRIAFEQRATFDTARPVTRPWLYGIALAEGASDCVRYSVCY
jgi:hypothetical protein